MDIAKEGTETKGVAMDVGLHSWIEGATTLWDMGHSKIVNGAQRSWLLFWTYIFDERHCLGIK